MTSTMNFNELASKWFNVDGGIKTDSNRPDGFNDILPTTQFYLARKLLGTITESEASKNFLYLFKRVDEFGLYRPKHSHDNSTFLIINHLVFNPGFMNIIDFGALIRGANYHPKDVLWYMLFHRNLGIKLLGHVLSPITCGFMLISFASSGKVRPAWWRSLDSLKARIRPIHDKPISVEHGEVFGGTYVVRTYKNGDTFRFTKTQNDGKILNVFKLAVVKDSNPVFWLFAKVARSVLINKYGENYLAGIFANYYRELDNPVKGIYTENNIDILKRKIL